MYMYSRYGITFNRADWWCFCNNSAKNVIIFGVDGSSSSHAENPKNNFLILSLGPTFGKNGIFGSPEKKFSINFIKANTKILLEFTL